MYLVQTTDTFDRWLKKLKDKKARAKILVRIKRIQTGNMGTINSIGLNLLELKITYGPGYRIYFTRQKKSIIILLCGGDKSSQSTDIKKANSILKELEDNNDIKN